MRALRRRSQLEYRGRPKRRPPAQTWRFGMTEMADSSAAMPAVSPCGVSGYGSALSDASGGGTDGGTAPDFPVPPSITLPKGGGAIRGIGEKLTANPITGTASLSVPIATSPGRAGFGPQLVLTYDSGEGNGPFGSGWGLTLPAISHNPDLPRRPERPDPRSGKGGLCRHHIRSAAILILDPVKNNVPGLQPKFRCGLAMLISRREVGCPHAAVLMT